MLTRLSPLRNGFGLSRKVNESTFRSLTIRGRPRIGTGRRQPSRLETITQLESDGKVAAVKTVMTWRVTCPLSAGR